MAHSTFCFSLTNLGKQCICFFVVMFGLQYLTLILPTFVTHETVQRNNEIASIYNSNTESISECLIIILSSTRAYDLTWPSFKRHMLDVTNCDLALCVGTYHENTANPFYEHAKYVWIWNETNILQRLQGSKKHFSFVHVWEKSFDQLQIMANLSVDHKWKTLFDFYHKDITWCAPIGSTAGSGGILLFFRQFLYFKLIQYDLVHKYKYFMYTRSDYKYHCDFEYYKMFKYAIETKNVSSNVMNKAIWISSGQEYGGITDRNLLTTNEHILDSLDILLNVFTNYSYFEQRIRQRYRSKVINIEQMVEFHLQSKQLWSKVHKYHQVMYLVRSNITDTRFSQGKYDKKRGIFVKYFGEWNKARKYCPCLQNQENNTWKCMPVEPLDAIGDLRG